MILGRGWLARNLGLPALNHGVRVPRWSAKEHAPFPTRTEEYWFVANALERTRRGFVVDAGAGFNPEIHLLAYILGNMLYDVYAVDQHPAGMAMPYHPRVQRALGDIQHLSLDDRVADIWVCVSTLEHLEPTARAETAGEAFRVLNHGGFAIVTMDNTEPERLTGLMSEAGFQVGSVVPLQGEPLTPPVGWIVAQKP